MPEVLNYILIVLIKLIDNC